MNTAVLTVLAISAVSVNAQQDNQIRLNQIQVIGTHNSYHAGLAPGVATILKNKSPRTFAALDYSHPSLTSQLSSGIRQIELDIFADAKGGLYAHPAGPGLVAKAGLPADPDFDPQHLMEKPGFKVMHVQDLDYRSNCQPFTACLSEVRAWSQAHPQHLPIFILVEIKQSEIKTEFPSTKPEPFSSAVFDALDKEITSIFPINEIITPDQVRGNHSRLDEAVRDNGWPTLAAARGKIVFLMDQKNVGPTYLEGHPALKGRILFTNADPGSPDAAFIEQNDSSAETISAIVRQGYLVRTRTDSDTIQARTNDTHRRDEALASGAQILSTDYPSSEPATSGYSVGFPANEAARCNPILKPPSCVDSLLEAKP